MLGKSKEKSNVTSERGTDMVHQNENKDNHYKKLEGFLHHM